MSNNKKDNRDAKYMIFDVEAIGLHGEGFAVGWVVVNLKGFVYEARQIACHPDKAQGTEEGRLWVRDNVPALPETHPTPKHVRDEFWQVWQRWRSQGALLVADCCWPVESRFLQTCVDDNPADRAWLGPYPLHELASVLLAKGIDPLQDFERAANEYLVHSPLADARHSARKFIHAMVAGRIFTPKEKQ